MVVKDKMQNAVFNQEIFYKHLAEQGFIEFFNGGKRITVKQKGIDYFDSIAKQKPELCLLIFLIYTDYFVNFPKDLERLRK